MKKFILLTLGMFVALTVGYCVPKDFNDNNVVVHQQASYNVLSAFDVNYSMVAMLDNWRFAEPEYFVINTKLKSTKTISHFVLRNNSRPEYLARSGIGLRNKIGRYRAMRK